MSPTTTDPALKLGAIASALCNRLGAVTGLNVLDHEPFGKAIVLPSACVSDVIVRRRDRDEPESEFGVSDWIMTWTLVLRVDLKDPEAAYAAARALTGQVMAALDADRNLGGEVEDSRLVRAEMEPNDPKDPVRLLVVTCDVDALALMP